MWCLNQRTAAWAQTTCSSTNPSSTKCECSPVAFPQSRAYDLIVGSVDVFSRRPLHQDAVSWQLEDPPPLSQIPATPDLQAEVQFLSTLHGTSCSGLDQIPFHLISVNYIVTGFLEGCRLNTHWQHRLNSLQNIRFTCRDGILSYYLWPVFCVFGSIEVIFQAKFYIMHLLKVQALVVLLQC